MLLKLVLGSILWVSIGLGFIQPTFAQTYSADCPTAGRYALVGRVPGATGSYTGEATVSANGSGMKWFPPNASEGTGTYVAGVLTIYFTYANGAGSGVVKYTRANNGEFHGVWLMNNNPENQGTETLRPIALAPR